MNTTVRHARWFTCRSCTCVCANISARPMETCCRLCHRRPCTAPASFVFRVSFSWARPTAPRKRLLPPGRSPARQTGDTDGPDRVGPGSPPARPCINRRGLLGRRVRSVDSGEADRTAASESRVPSVSCPLHPASLCSRARKKTRARNLRLVLFPLASRARAPCPSLPSKCGQTVSRGISLLPRRRLQGSSAGQPSRRLRSRHFAPRGGPGEGKNSR